VTLDVTTPLHCQAEDCIEPPEFVCDASVMVPPTRGFLPMEIVLCAKHAEQFEKQRQIAILIDQTNPDLVSAARWRD
jgi:hypothetical protein